MPSEKQKKQITEDIFKKTQESMKRAGFTRDKIAKELFILAFSDMANYVKVDDEGRITAINFENLKKNTRAIKKIKQKRRLLLGKGDDAPDCEIEDFEFELYNKQDALQFVAAILGMEKPKQVEHTGKDGGPIVHEHTIHKELAERVKDLI